VRHLRHADLPGAEISTFAQPFNPSMCSRVIHRDSDKRNSKSHRFSRSPMHAVSGAGLQCARARRQAAPAWRWLQRRMARAIRSLPDHDAGLRAAEDDDGQQT
jgi:hypothetical protein